MAPFSDDDRSVEGSAPIEVFTFTSQRASPNEVVARSTSWHRDVVFGGFTFTARPIRRGATAYENVSANLREMTVEVDSRDPAAAFYLGLGVPPQKFDLHIRQIQQTSGGDQRIFRGTVTACRLAGRTATFTVTQQLDDPLATAFPGWQVSRRCQRTLYDSGCGKLRADNDVITTIAAIGDFRSIQVTSIGGFAVGDFKYGELLHTPSGERRSIRYDSATRMLHLDVRLPSTAANLDAVTFWRGCSRTVEECRDKFSNVVNFGGHPHIKTTRFFWDHPSLMRMTKGDD